MITSLNGFNTRIIMEIFRSSYQYSISRKRMGKKIIIVSKAMVTIQFKLFSYALHSIGIYFNNPDQL